MIGRSATTKLASTTADAPLKSASALMKTNFVECLSTIAMCNEQMSHSQIDEMLGTLTNKRETFDKIQKMVEMVSESSRQGKISNSTANEMFAQLCYTALLPDKAALVLLEDLCSDNTRKGKK